MVELQNSAATVGEVADTGGSDWTSNLPGKGGFGAVFGLQ